MTLSNKIMNAGKKTSNKVNNIFKDKESVLNMVLIMGILILLVLIAKKFMNGRRENYNDVNRIKVKWTRPSRYVKTDGTEHILPYGTRFTYNILIEVQGPNDSNSWYFVENAFVNEFEFELKNEYITNPLSNFNPGNKYTASIRAKIMGATDEYYSEWSPKADEVVVGINGTPLPPTNIEIEIINDSPLG